MFFHEESQSSKAVRMVDKPRAADVRRFEWLPKSLLIHVSKFPKGAGADYAEWEMTIPEFLAEQKDLGEFEV